MMADHGDLQHVICGAKTYSITKCIIPYTQRHQGSVGLQHGTQQASCLWCHAMATCVQLFQNGVRFESCAYLLHLLQSSLLVTSL